ncbi:hypothetical protein VNI00_008307 [Paramarasmius palmivorus]|uniref:Blue (type 1) copper domain-containing protein n=1 Tax=Paramarasmius palmivorus TaxID=297713 RepID=A0AAW0CX79_9AGAR
MSVFSLFFLAYLSALALAQYGGYGGGGGSPTNNAPSVPSAPPSTDGHVNVDVFFNGNFAFNPPSVTATNGTLVTFYFPGGSFPHSVTQSSFASPCAHLEADTTAGTPAGFDSGLVNAVQFTINITDDTQPIWFHCKFPLHCGMGMVGSINAPTTGDNTFEAFQAAAMNIGNSEQTEPDNGFVMGGVNGVAVSAPSSSGAAQVAASGGPIPSQSFGTGAGPLPTSQTNPDSSNVSSDAEVAHGSLISLLIGNAIIYLLA